MKSIKKKSINALADGISKYEDSKNILKNSDYTDLNTFSKDYLNTSNPKQRRLLAKEFKKRHLELYEFLKDNSDFLSIESDMTKILATVLSGESEISESNLADSIRQAYEKRIALEGD